MSLWLTHPLLLPSLIVGVTIVLWATPLLPEFITALLFSRRRWPPESPAGSNLRRLRLVCLLAGVQRLCAGCGDSENRPADRAARALSAKLTDSGADGGKRCATELCIRCRRT